MTNKRNRCNVFTSRIAKEKFEEMLIDFIESLKERKIAITSYIISEKIKELEPGFKNNGKALYYWILKFFKKIGMTFRKNIKGYEKKLSFEDIEKCYKHIEKMKQLNTDSLITGDNIINTDESSLYPFCMVPKSWHIPNEQEKITSPNSDKYRVTLMLAVGSSGLKFPLGLIFKGERDGKIHVKELLEKNEYKSGKCFISCNNKAWTCKTDFSRYVKYFLKHSYLESNENSLLIFNFLCKKIIILFLI